MARAASAAAVAAAAGRRLMGLSTECEQPPGSGAAWNFMLIISVRNCSSLYDMYYMYTASSLSAGGHAECTGVMVKCTCGVTLR